MSGYASKAEAVDVVKLSIIEDSAKTGLSRDPADFNLAALMRETVSGGGYYGWKIEMDSETFIAALWRNLRVWKRERILAFTPADFRRITHEPLSDYRRQCHAASLRLVRSGVLGPARVARGTCPGVGSQHSWVVLGMDCYAQDITILDPTLWSWTPEERTDVYVGPPQGHRPHGTGDIWKWGQPVPGGGEIIELDRESLSVEANSFLDILDPLDLRGWMVLSGAPVGGWPAREIFEKMLDDDRLSALIPIDIEGMLTDRNPSGLYLAGAAEVDGQLRVTSEARTAVEEAGRA